MPFYSKYANKIWNELYTVSIPDLLTYDPEYIKRFGAPSTGDRSIDEKMSKNMVTVMIPVIKIAEYYSDGVAISLPNRKDMLEIYTNINNYLDEWLHYSRANINSEADIINNKSTILLLEKLAKELHSRAKDKELITSLFGEKKTSFGLVTELQKLNEEQAVTNRPDYEGIGNLLKKKKNPNPGSRF